MATNGPFGIDPEDFERALRGASAEFRELLAKAGVHLDRVDQIDLGSVLGQFFSPRPTPAPNPEGDTAGDTGSGVWVIFGVDDDGRATVDQVFPTELEALRAHRDNTDDRRRVRFLPYGVPASVLDTP